LISFSPADTQLEPGDDVLDAERNQLRAAERAGEAEQQQRAVAPAAPAAPALIADGEDLPHRQK
jgi:hypothetical protein